MLDKSNKPVNGDELPWDAISWWLLLIVAVLAIPALGFVIVTVTGVEGIMGILVFMFACWACTYFGMHLVKHPSMSEKKDITKP
jgi:hypothetical protein